MINNKETHPNGLQTRYYISKVDNTPVDPNAEYFVLRLDRGGDAAHVSACRKAILVYADEIEPHIPELAQDLRSLYGN